MINLVQGSLVPIVENQLDRVYLCIVVLTFVLYLSELGRLLQFEKILEHREFAHQGVRPLAKHDGPLETRSPRTSSLWFWRLLSLHLDWLFRFLWRLLGSLRAFIALPIEVVRFSHHGLFYQPILTLEVDAKHGHMDTARFIVCCK